MGLAIPVIEGGDHFSQFRFYQPLWPLLPLPAFAAARWLADHVDMSDLQLRLSRLRVPVLLVVGLSFVAASTTKWFRLRDLPFAGEIHIAQRGRVTGERLNALFTDVPDVGVLMAGGTSPPAARLRLVDEQRCVYGFEVFVSFRPARDAARIIEDHVDDDSVVYNDPPVPFTPWSKSDGDGILIAQLNRRAQLDGSIKEQVAVDLRRPSRRRPCLQHVQRRLNPTGQPYHRCSQPMTRRHPLDERLGTVRICQCRFVAEPNEAFARCQHRDARRQAPRRSRGRSIEVCTDRLAEVETGQQRDENPAQRVSYG
ncbi:MAG: hypothetical protein VX948_16985 [Candidatus Latescibacterota bacterium]|nr:hypothetical protein [Candidatus Latescibacterota bacterium]